MKVLIIGGGGVIGQKLARKLVDRGHLRGADIAHMTLADVVNPAPITAGFPVDVVRVDIADRASVDKLIAGRYDVIYLLAAIVSAHAEEDFDAGMNINLFGSYHVFEAVRALGTKPVIVFHPLSLFMAERCLTRLRITPFLIRKHPTERKRRLVNCC